MPYKDPSKKREKDFRYAELIRAKVKECSDWTRQDLIVKLVGLEAELRSAQRDAAAVRRRVIELDRALLKVRDSVLYVGQHSVAFAAPTRDEKIIVKNVERILTEIGYVIRAKKGNSENGKES